MKTKKIFIFLIVFILASFISYGFQANSSNFDLSAGTVSSGGDIINSSTYKNYVATGIIAGVTNSSTYKNSFGFFYTWLLANNQPCTSNSQCSGGFCCSNLCSSSTCPVEEEATAGGGAAAAAAGGGGGGFLTRGTDYSLSVSNVKIKLVLGESGEQTFTIKNTGTVDFTVSLSVEGVSEYVTLSDNSIGLAFGDEVEVTINYIAKQVGGFAGQIILTAGDVVKSIPIIFEIISDLVLFDVKLDILAEYTEVEQGGELKTQITLLNVGAPENVDVIVTYFIKDLRGNIIHEESETFAVEEQRSYLKSFKINENIEPGSYVVVVEVRYVDSFAVSSHIFNVVEKKAFVAVDIITKNTALMILLTFLVVVILAFLIFKLVSIGKTRK